MGTTKHRILERKNEHFTNNSQVSHILSSWKNVLSFTSSLTKIIVDTVNSVNMKMHCGVL